ncbi:MAG: T9SS type A sorting domain-containing protein [Ginsengibacter sp.]
MKKVYLVFCCLLSLGCFGQQIFNGNGKTGYGGVIGTGNLSINDNGTTITFILTKGASPLNDAMVIFVDTKSGGFATTSGFTDEADGLRKAISGLQTPNRATLNFPSGFLPDYAIALDQSFAGIWELVNGGSHNYINSANLTPSGNPNAATYTFTVAKTDIGITKDVVFSFLATYGSETGYRSNEFIGDAGPSNNPDNTPYTATSFMSYVSALPVSITHFNALSNGNNIVLKWGVAQESNIALYKIFHSVDGTNFNEAGSVASLGNTSSKREYSFTDDQPSRGNNYYKISILNRDGSVDVSKTINIKLVSLLKFKTFINASQELVVEFKDIAKNNFDIKIYNMSGQQVYTNQISHSGADHVYKFPLNNKFIPGIYSLQINAPGERYSQMVLKK